MYAYALEIEYTPTDGRAPHHAMGTEVIVYVDGRYGPARASSLLVERARTLAARQSDPAVLVGILPMGTGTLHPKRVQPLPNGSRCIRL